MPELTVAIDFHSMEKKYNGSQWLSSTLWLPIFCVQQTKETHNFKKLGSGSSGGWVNDDIIFIFTL